MNFKFSAYYFLPVVLLIAAGCSKSADELAVFSVKVDIQIKDCNELEKHITKPIAIIDFTDERQAEDEDDLVLLNCQWREFAVEELERTVTQAFEQGLGCSGANITDVNNASFYLSGTITKFGIWACVKDYIKYTSTAELELNLELKDSRGKVVWTKTISDDEIKLSIYSVKRLPIRSDIYVTDRAIIFERRGEIWRLTDAVNGYVRKSVLSAVNILLSDESFWQTVGNK